MPIDLVYFCNSGSLYERAIHSKSLRYNALPGELMRMNAGVKLVLGCIAIIAGCIFGLLLLRAMIVGRIINVWMLLSDLLFLGVAAYLIYVGLRGIYSAKGRPLPPARFGWGRIVFGAVFLFSNANSHFHLFAVRNVVKEMAPSSPTQVVVMNIAAVVSAILCIALIVWGIARGLRKPSAEEEPVGSAQQVS